MSFDPSVVERIPPDRWRNSQLSVVRFSSGCIINGVHYILDPDTDFLVRTDVWSQEIKDVAKQKRVAVAEKNKWDAAAQSGLFESLGAV
jgi:hypothetical protein